MGLTLKGSGRLAIKVYLVTQRQSLDDTKPPFLFSVPSKLLCDRSDLKTNPPVTVSSIPESEAWIQVVGGGEGGRSSTLTPTHDEEEGDESLCSFLFITAGVFMFTGQRVLLRSGTPLGLWTGPSLTESFLEPKTCQGRAAAQNCQNPAEP